MKAIAHSVGCSIPAQLPGRQKGAVLVLGLILLLILTLIGVSTMQGSVFDEKMAGNTRDRNFAFQASESALRDGELWLLNSSSEPLWDATGSSGVWGLNDPGAGDWWEGGGPWGNGAPSVVTLTGIDNIQAQPQRIIEYTRFVRDELDSPTSGPPTGKVYYRVTSKATGGTDSAIVQLQSMYSKRY